LLVALQDRLRCGEALVEEEACVFIAGRRQKELDEAAKAIGDNVAGDQGDVFKLYDLDGLYETVNAEGRRIDVG
jgi:NADP-dependent 3-hydroxy acid dehydrogenase YdfG